MADFGRFRAGLEFCFPVLGFFLEGHEVFLKLPSEVFDVLLVTIEYEYCVAVTIPFRWSAIYIPLTEISSIKEIPTVCPILSFLLMY